MGRGHIFEICNEENKNNLFFMAEEDFYDRLSEIGTDYVANVTDQEVISYLWQGLKNILCLDKYGTWQEVTLQEGNAVKFTLEEINTTAYFCPKFIRMKKLCAELGLEDFERDSDDVWKLQQSIVDTCGDAVYYNSVFYPLDKFMRIAKPGENYYIGNIIFMH